MTKRFNFLIILFIVFILSSCSFNTNEIFIIDEIKVSDSPEENEKIGNDLISYDFSSMIMNDLKITDQDVLKNITWQYFVADASKTVTFRLILNSKAKDYKDTLIPFFENFVKNKIEEYKTKKDYLPEVIDKSNSLMELINKSHYDSIWTQTSPDLKRITSKENFYKVFEERKVKFKPEGERSVNNRLLLSKLGNIKGEFYVINYAYPNKLYDQIILQRNDNRLELASYIFFTSNK